MRDKWKLPATIVLLSATLLLWRCAQPNRAPSTGTDLPIFGSNTPAAPRPETNAPAGTNAVTRSNAASPSAAVTNPPARVSAPDGTPPPHRHPVQAGFDQIIADVLARDPQALPRLSAISQDLHGYLKRGEGAPDNLFERFWQVFTRIGELAAQGEPAAFDALVAAAADPFLQGVAVKGLGVAAGQGHEGALAMLLNPKEHGLHDTVGALQPAADAGNQRAISGIAEYAYRTNSAGLWYMIVTGLEKAAVNGNRTAIDAVREVARKEGNQGVTEARRVLRRVGEPLPQ